MEKRLLILLLCPLLLFWHWNDPAAKKNQQGIAAYQQQKYQEALNQFLSAKGIKPDLPELKLNTASALYQLKKYEEALEEFSKIDLEKSKLSKSHFYYNLGNSYFRLNKFKEALENFKQSLKLDPKDMDAKKNYEITLQKMKKQKGQNDQKQDKQPKQKDKKHQNLMQYLNQKEKQQLEKKQKEKKNQKAGVSVREKDW